MTPLDYLDRIRKWAERHESKPITWGHVVLASLDIAMSKSSYREEPLLRELRSELRREALDRTGSDMDGLTSKELAEGARELARYEHGKPSERGLQDRILRFLSDRPTQLDDWTLGVWRRILDGCGLTPEHFVGQAEWPATWSTTARATATAIPWREALEALVGLKSVKEHVRALHGFLRIERMREAKGLPKNVQSLHSVFLGNPGTGKTSVARILGRIYGELGILATGHFVEVDRSQLVGTHIGETEANTRAVVKRALGGVLFIDEAYSLATGGENDFGQRAIDQLVRDMSEHRDALVVIAAGYAKEMERFVGANPGLRSRFANYMQFDDYSDDELVDIFVRLARERRFRIPDDIGWEVTRRIAMVRRERGREFGNAREIHTLWDQALRRQGIRLTKAVDRGEEIESRLNELLREDLRGDGKDDG